MSVFLVNSSGVSFAMSFMYELSTMATFIEPPPEPPPSSSSSSPQPASTSPASSAAINPKRAVPLMVSSSCLVAGDR
jgi:hypothetical protein